MIQRGWMDEWDYAELPTMLAVETADPDAREVVILPAREYDAMVDLCDAVKRVPAARNSPAIYKALQHLRAQEGGTE